MTQPILPDSPMGKLAATSAAETAEKRARDRQARSEGQKRRFAAEKARKAAIAAAPPETPAEAGLTEAQTAYLDWLVDPERDGTKTAYASTHGHGLQTLRNWEKRPDFRRQIEQRMDEMGASPERAAQIVNALFKAAMTGDVPAMKLYLEYTKRFTPTSKVVVDRGLEAMSDEELEELAMANFDGLRSVA